MIRQIETSDALQAAQSQSGAPAVSPATAAGKSFASVLEREKIGASRESNEDLRAARAPDHPKTPINAPEGEVWKPVRSGNNYARIVDGPRTGQYVNLSRGERHGQLFRVEERDGVRVHVYGEGEGEKVVVAWKDSGRVKPDKDEESRASRVPDNERWAPVNGVSNYADILNGRRNGYYVNTSGGDRDGMAFQIVHRDDRTFHVYGKGKHRQVVEVSSSARDDDKKADGPKRGDDGKRPDGAEATDGGKRVAGANGSESTGGVRADG